MVDRSDPGQQAAHNEGPRRRNRAWYLLAVPVLAVLLTWSLNYGLVGYPVAKKLSADPRNSGFSIGAHYRYYIDPNTLVLNLRQLENAAPVDLFRALFQSAEALHETGHSFDRVVLARAGTPVFFMKGGEFFTMGAEFGAGQNPVFLIRTLPEKLYRLNGAAAFGHWEGGMLGVLGKQMEDADQAVQQWATGT